MGVRWSEVAMDLNKPHWRFRILLIDKDSHWSVWNSDRYPKSSFDGLLWPRWSAIICPLHFPPRLQEKSEPLPAMLDTSLSGQVPGDLSGLGVDLFVLGVFYLRKGWSLRALSRFAILSLCLAWDWALNCYGLSRGLTTTMGRAPELLPFSGTPAWPIPHHVMNFPGGKQRMPHGHGLKRFHAVCTNRDWSLWEQPCSHLTPRKPWIGALTFIHWCTVGLRCGGFALKKKNPFISSLIGHACLWGPFLSRQPWAVQTRRFLGVAWSNCRHPGITRVVWE